VIPTGTVCCHSFWHLIWKYIWSIIWHIFPDIIVWHSIWHYLTFYSDILFWHYIWHLFNLFWHPFWPILTFSLTWELPSEIRRSRLSKEDEKEKVPLTKLETLTWQVGKNKQGSRQESTYKTGPSMGELEVWCCCHMGTWVKACSTHSVVIPMVPGFSHIPTWGRFKGFVVIVRPYWHTTLFVDCLAPFRVANLQFSLANSHQNQRCLNSVDSPNAGWKYKHSHPPNWIHNLQMPMAQHGKSTLQAAAACFQRDGRWLDQPGMDVSGLFVGKRKPTPLANGGCYALVNIYITMENHGKSTFLMGKSTMSMAIFKFANYECLPGRVSIFVGRVKSETPEIQATSRSVTCTCATWVPVEPVEPVGSGSCCLETASVTKANSPQPRQCLKLDGNLVPICAN